MGDLKLFDHEEQTYQEDEEWGKDANIFCPGGIPASGRCLRRRHLREQVAQASAEEPADEEMSLE